MAMVFLCLASMQNILTEICCWIPSMDMVLMPSYFSRFVYAQCPCWQLAGITSCVSVCLTSINYGVGQKMGPHCLIAYVFKNAPVDLYEFGIQHKHFILHVSINFIFINYANWSGSTWWTRTTLFSLWKSTCNASLLDIYSQNSIKKTINSKH